MAEWKGQPTALERASLPPISAACWVGRAPSSQPLHRAAAAAALCSAIADASGVHASLWYRLRNRWEMSEEMWPGTWDADTLGQHDGALLQQLQPPARHLRPFEAPVVKPQKSPLLLV